jgi:CubicO group peptidase (beta-lactamase class C family)
MAALAAPAMAQAPASTQASAPGSPQSSLRVAQVLANSGFRGELLVADLERVRLTVATGGPVPGQRWRWASVSKQVAAALAMRQVQAGRLGLDDPVARHLAGTPAAAAAAAHPALTVRHLLMHTSGLPNPEVSALPADPLPTCLGAATHPPGQRFEYRNCDTLVLAAVLVRVAGRPYAELLRDELAAAGVGRVELATAPPELAAYGAAGALTGTALELLAFDRALLAGRWLAPEHTRTLWTGEPRLGHVALGAWAYPVTLPGCTAPVEVVERRGAVPGVQVRNLLVPSRGLAIVVFTPSERFDFGEVWQGRGFAHNLLAATVCD